MNPDDIMACVPAWYKPARRPEPWHQSKGRKPVQPQLPRKQHHDNRRTKRQGRQG